MFPARPLIAFILLSSGAALYLALLYPGASVQAPAAEQSRIASPAPVVLPATVVPEDKARLRSTANVRVAPRIAAATPAELNGGSSFRVASAQDIPFPLYPNGRRYRIGGEDGMKIALFETTDDFSTVDAYYDHYAPGSGLTRNPMTDDYVEYLQPVEGSSRPLSAAQAGRRPGVVIHQIDNADEATRLGAAPDAKTNIIISFR